jgi:hypothetical protein
MTKWVGTPAEAAGSHLNQNIQAADWIAAIIDKLWTYRLGGIEWQNLKPYEDYFWGRVHRLATHSTVMERPKKKTVSLTSVTAETVTVETTDTAISAAFRRASYIKGAIKK